MRPNVKATVLAAILTLAFAGALAAQAPSGGRQHPMRGGQMGPGMGPSMQQHVEQMMAQLNLSDAQKQQVRQLLSANQQKMTGLTQQMQQLHGQLRDQLFADEGPGDTSALAKQIGDVQAEMLHAQIEVHEQISKILDPAQRKKMREMAMPGMMGMGTGRGGRGQH